MDPVTHAVVGSLAGVCANGRADIRVAAAVGALAALVPDADVFIRSASDPLLTLEFHRGFTHALITVPVIALLVTLAVSPITKRWASWQTVAVAAFAGALTSGLLDACTSYGTALLWPFVDRRIALSIVSVLDPLLTLVLIGFLATALTSTKRLWAAWGFSCLLVYLGAGWIQHHRAAFVAEVLANDRGHEVERFTVKPTLGNLVLWRTIYQSDGRYFVDAVRLAPFSDIEIFAGSSVPEFDIRATPVPVDSVQGRDIERFNEFSDGYSVFHPSDPFVVADIRYSLMPDSTNPLWGIRLDPSKDDQHAEYVTFRDTSGELLQRFATMVFVGGYAAE